MKAEKDKKTGKWLIQYRYTDWQGKRRKSTKRGFATKREAEEWLRNFLITQKADFDMKFEDFWKMYYADMETRLREHTMRTKKYIVELKILPYFGNKRVNDITAADIRQWQNELIKMGYSPTYLKTINNQLSASSSWKRKIKTEAQYREYQMWHVEVQDELKLGKRELKRQIQLADGIIKEDLYTAYYVVSENEEIVADREIEIPEMEEKTAVEEVVAVVVEPDANVEEMNPNNNQNEIGRQKEQTDSAKEQQIDLDGKEISEAYNLTDVNVARMDESITDITGKSEFVEPEEKEPVDKAGWIVSRISELGGYENVSDSVKADIFGFDIADVSGSIRLFSDVMKSLGIKLDGDELYEEFQRIYDESVGRGTDKEKVEDKMWNRGRGR